MGNILVIDDIQFWRDTASDVLKNQPHSVLTSATGEEALAVLNALDVNLLILDVDMPGQTGLSLLETVRRDARWKNIPVIMLTGDMRRQHILLAKQLGALDYLLKARFSPQALCERVAKYLAPASDKRVENKAAPVPVALPVPITLETCPQLISRDDCLARAKQAIAGQTFAGVILEVITAAGSPRTNHSELATMIGRDPLLTSRVLQAANSASNVTSQEPITTLENAVSIVGRSPIRDIAASVGIFESMPLGEPDGFDAARSLQHAIGVAKLCDSLAPPSTRSIAYLAGLGHDFGELLFRSRFGPEYQQVLQAHKASNLPLHQLERKMLGATQVELGKEILRCLNLPEAISDPIDLFHNADRTGAMLTDPLAKALQIADAYANGCLMASSVNSLVRPFTPAECRFACGGIDPVRPVDAQMRGELVALTAVYARLPDLQLKQLMLPMLPKSERRLYLVRDPELSAYDPVAAALESLATVTVGSSLPAGAELCAYQGLIILAANRASTGLTSAEIETYRNEILDPNFRILLLAANPETVTPPEQSPTAVARWPISLGALANFIQSIK